jgi:hypothetical protein
MTQTQPSIWSLKPWWCQPWSILLTGLTLIGGSWFVFGNIWLSICTALPLSAWMGYFLILYPRLMQEMMQEEREEEQ